MEKKQKKKASKKAKAAKKDKAIPKEQKEKIDKTKFKTEMCKNWIETGFCRYHDRCQFAHGF